MFVIADEYKVLAKRGLQVMSEEGGYYFVKNEHGAIFPINDTTVAKWLKEHKESEKN